VCAKGGELFWLFGGGANSRGLDREIVFMVLCSPVKCRR